MGRWQGSRLLPSWAFPGKKGGDSTGHSEVADRCEGSLERGVHIELRTPGPHAKEAWFLWGEEKGLDC